jgi:hypothetical protein
MPDLQEMFRRLHDVVAEHRLAAQAVGRLKSAVQNGEVGLPSPTDQGDLVRTAGNLEPTYLVRLWAEFETALRSYRRDYTGRPDDQIRAIDLINWTAALKQGRTVSLASRELVHAVREYRNSLVHERNAPAPTVAIDEARSRLNGLLAAKLPRTWHDMWNVYA